MISTITVALLCSECCTVSTPLRPQFSEVCQQLFKGYSSCATATLLNEDQICFVPENTSGQPNNIHRKQVNLVQKISACKEWTTIRFTTVQGHRCIENKASPGRNLSTNNHLALHRACEDGKLDVVRHILTSGLVDINSRGKRGRTPIMVAARNGQVNVFDFLLAQNCDLSARDDRKDTVLHVACKGGNADIVRKLIDTGKCNMDSKGEFGMTSIMDAAYFGPMPVFLLLVSKGCKMTGTDDHHNSLLHFACMGGQLHILKYMISHNVSDVNVKGQFGRTPLMMAAEMGHRKIVEYLIRSGCNVVAVDDGGNSVLHVASISGYVDMVKCLCKLKVVKGMKRWKNKRGLTPAKLADGLGHGDIVAYLKARK